MDFDDASLRGPSVDRGDVGRRRGASALGDGDVGVDGDEGVGTRAREGVRCENGVARTTTRARERAREGGGERERHLSTHRPRALQSAGST